jgi:hypothetical protein
METKYRYYIGFKSGNDFSFDTCEKIDFHTLKPGYISFNNLLLNLSEVEYIKEVDKIPD